MADKFLFLYPTKIYNLQQPILATEQYGFRKDYSTEQAAYTLVNGIFQAGNSKLQVVGVLCGLSKAFDCVNHDISVWLMKHTDWIKSYLHNRRQS